MQQRKEIIMRELEKTEIETVAGGHRGDFEHAYDEAKAAFRETGNLGFAVVTFTVHFDFASN